MRYSNEAFHKPAELLSVKASNRAFFEAVNQTHKAEALRGGLLLIGGNDWRSMALRHAQSSLRFDRRASLWSHVALIARWDADDVGASIGLEVSLDPEDCGQQAPERNGVTAFKLARYFDTERYRNVAVVAVDLGKGSDGKARKDALLDAACNPCRHRERYPLWNALSSWARYAYAPELVQAPLLDGIAMPSAAYCEYAFESAGVDLTPGATGNNACPEVVWATVTYWQEQMKDQVGFDASMIFRDPGAASPDAMPLSIVLPSANKKPSSKASKTAAKPPKPAARKTKPSKKR